MDPNLLYMECPITSFACKDEIGQLPIRMLPKQEGTLSQEISKEDLRHGKLSISKAQFERIN